MKPALLVIAGPNGAGKTTVPARLREDHWSHGVEYLDARREKLLAAGAGIAFETVLSTHAKLDFLARAKQRGYFVRVFFIGTSDPRINASVENVEARLCFRTQDAQLRKVYCSKQDAPASASDRERARDRHRARER